MPRSLKRPSTGQIVWYFAATPPATVPVAAIVIKSRTDVDRVTFDLVIFDGVTGASSAVLGVKFYDGTRPTSGAWCTRVRVNEPAAGQWPSDR